MSHLSAVPTTPPQLSAPAARQMTDQIKADAEALWTKLLEAHDRGAHLALGFSSWGEYCKSEFGTAQSHAYRMLDAARVSRAIEEHSPIGERPRSEGVARALAPVLRDEGEQAVAETWARVVEEHGPQPTAAEVRESVKKKAQPPPEPKLTPEQQRFAHALSSMELGAEYVAATIARPGLLDVDDRLRAEWTRQARVIDAASQRLRRRFTR